MVGGHSCDEGGKSNELSVCQKILSIVAARASLFADQKMSGLPIREKYTHFKTIWEHTLLDVWGNKSTLSKSLITLWDCLRLWIVWGGEQASLLFTTGLTVLSWFWVVFPRTETIRSHSSRADNPSNLSPVSKETISDSVELCETAVCFLHIQLIGTNVWLPKMHNVPSEVDFESSISPAKSESWNSPSLHCLAVLHTWQYCLYSQVWWIYEINRFTRLSQALVHFVMDRASSVTDHRISGRPIRAKFKDFKTLWEQTCDNTPTDSSSSFLNRWSSKWGLETLYDCSVLLFASSQHFSNALLSMSFHVVWRRDCFCVRVLQNKQFLSTPSRNSWFKLLSVLLNDSFVGHAFIFECIPNTRGQGMMLVLQDQLASSISSTSEPYSAFCPAILMSSTYTAKNNPCFHWKNGHSQFDTSSHRSPIELSQIVFPTRGLQVGVNTNFAQEEPRDLQCLTVSSAIYVAEDVSIYQDILTLEFWAIWEHPTFSPGWKLILRGLRVLHNQIVLQWHLSLLRPSFCDADEPCSANTAYEPESSFTVSPRSATRPLYFWYFGSNSSIFWDDRCPSP